MTTTDDITFAVLGVSATPDETSSSDPAGDALVALGEAEGWECAGHIVAAQSRKAVYDALIDLADRRGADVVLTIGGTGFGPHELVPEATLDVADRLAPGIAEALRAASAQYSPRAMLGRGTSVLRGQSIIVNFPGSEKAVRESFSIVSGVLVHAVRMARGEGNCKTK